MRLGLVLVIAMLAAGCEHGVPTEMQSPRLRAVIQACFANGARRSNTSTFRDDAKTVIAVVKCQFVVEGKQP